MKTTPSQDSVNDDRFIKAFRRAMIVGRFGISGEFAADKAEFLAHRDRQKNYLVINDGRLFSVGDIVLLRSNDCGEELFLRVAHVTVPGTLGLPRHVGVIGTKLL